MAKYTMPQVISLLEAVGVTHVEVVDDEKDSDFNMDTALTAVDTTREAIIGPRLVAAKEAEILSGVSGKVNGSIRAEVARLTGVATKELDGLDTKEIVKKGLEHYAVTLGKGKEELRAELENMMSTHNTATETLKAEYEGKLSAGEKKYQTREIVDALTEIHTAAKGLPKDANRRALAESFYTLLSNQYNIKYDEAKKEVVLYDKTNPDIRAYTNEQKNTFMTPADCMVSTYKNQGLWSEDNRGVDPAKEMRDKETQGYVRDTNKPQSDFEKVIAATAAYAKA